MAGRTTIPKEIRSKIAELRKGGMTIDDIVARLGSETAAPPSRSAVGRETQKIDAVLKVHQSSVELSKALGKQLGQNENEINRGLAEVISTKMLELFAANDWEESADQVKILQGLARALSDVAKAQHLDVNTVAKIREEAEKAAIKKATATVRDTAKKQGLSEEALTEFMTALGG